MSTTLERLGSVVEIISRSGDPDKPFYYLGGPMTGIPQFNFPRFHEVGDILRDNGYNIISPAEIDDPETAAAALASPDGAPGSGSANGESYEDFLGRDLIVVSLPTCVGMICLEGWQNSRGATAESWVVSYLKRELLEYADGPTLTVIDRDERLRELGVDPRVSGTLPTIAPGIATVAARGSDLAAVALSTGSARRAVPVVDTPLGPMVMN
jgi:hypothetical protein